MSMPGGSNRRLESLLRNELLEIEDDNKGIEYNRFPMPE